MYSRIHKIEQTRKNIKSLADYYAGEAKEQSVADYYSSRAEYYAEQKDSHDQNNKAIWFGAGIEDLGVKAGEQASSGELARLLSLRNPKTNDELLSAEARNGKLKILGYDVTLSATKDASLLYLLADVEQREIIQQAYNTAVKAALEELEREVAVVRRGKGGIIHRQASGLVGVVTQHETARPVDGEVAPHLHTHLVFSSLAEADGRYSMIDAQRLYALKGSLGAIAGQVFRAETEKNLGIKWQKSRTSESVFEVVGIDRKLIAKLSPRRQQLLKDALEHGLDGSVAGREEARKATREGKEKCGDHSASLQALKEELEKSGITYDALGRANKKDAKHEQWLIRYKKVAVQAYGEPPDYRDKLARKNWEQNVAGALKKSQIIAPSMAGAWASDIATADARTEKEKQYDALRDLGRKYSTFTRAQYRRALAESGAQSQDYDAVFEQWLADEKGVELYGLAEDLVPDGYRVRTADQVVYASAETVEAERKLLDAARDRARGENPLCTQTQFEVVLNALAERGIVIAKTDEQYEMLVQILKGGSGISAVAGHAGAGKSTALLALSLASELVSKEEAEKKINELSDRKSIRWVLKKAAKTEEKAKEQGQQLLGCAVSAKASAGLQESAGIKSYSIAKLETLLLNGNLTLREGAIIVVDEASQASTQQLASLYSELEKVGGRLVLAGDARQHGSVEAGGVFSDLQQFLPEVVTQLAEVRRQKSASERVVLSAMHDDFEMTKETMRARKKYIQKGEEVDAELLGEVSVDTAIRWYQEHDRLHLNEDLTSVSQDIASKYWDAESDGKSTIVTAHTNEEVKFLADVIRSEAIKRGVLDDQQKVKIGEQEYLVGEKIIATQNDRESKMLNSEIGTIVGTKRVTTKWEVTYEVAGQKRKKTVHDIEKPKKGGTLTLELTESDVVRQKKWAEKWLVQVQESADKADKRLETAKEWQQKARTASAQKQARERVARAEASVKKYEDVLDKAYGSVAWAENLPKEGGRVDVKIGSVEAKHAEKRVAVEVEGVTKYLSESYLASCVSGYAVTGHRAQGVTVDVALELGISYVGMSRGREENHSYVIVSEEMLAEEAEAYRQWRLEEPTDKQKSYASYLGVSIAGNRGEVADRIAEAVGGASLLERSKAEREAKAREKMHTKLLKEQLFLDRNRSKSVKRTVWERAQAEELAMIGLPTLVAIQQEAEKEYRENPTDENLLKLQDARERVRRFKGILVADEKEERVEKPYPAKDVREYKEQEEAYEEAVVGEAMRNEEYVMPEEEREELERLRAEDAEREETMEYESSYSDYDPGYDDYERDLAEREDYGEYEPSYDEYEEDIAV